MSRKRKQPDVEELSMETPEILVELRAAKDTLENDNWPLAVIRGGVDRMTIKRTGRTTTIKIVSPDGGTYSDGYNPQTPGWEQSRKMQLDRRRQAKLAAQHPPKPV